MYTIPRCVITLLQVQHLRPTLNCLGKGLRGRGDHTHNVDKLKDTDVAESKVSINLMVTEIGHSSDECWEGMPTLNPTRKLKWVSICYFHGIVL